MSMNDAMAETIRTYFAGDDAVVAVYLFGSHATGKASATSDIDLAVLLREKPAFDYRLRTMTNLATLLHREVDVVVLDQCGPIMQRQVMKYGVLLFERDRRKRIEFEVRARKMYLDFLPAHRRYVAKLEERLLKGA